MTVTRKVRDPVKALERARARIDLGRARLTLRAVERAKRIQEQQETWEWLGGFADVMDRLRSASRDASYPFSTAQDRRFGDYWPFWRTWQEHARIRASSRLLYGVSGMASGAIDGIASYVIGEGFTYRVVAKRVEDERTLASLIGACQEVLDDFAVANDWPAWEQEFFIRSCRDGEFFIRHFADDDGLTTTCEIEPEQVVEPPGHDRSTTSYGILNEPDNLHEVTGYAVAYDGNTAGAEEVPAADIIHLKRNVDRKVKRGLPDLSFDSHDLLRSGGRLLQALAIGSTIQASIAWVRQHDTATGTQIEDFVAGASAYTSRDPVSGSDVRQQRIEPGTILDIDKGQTFVSSPMNAGVPYFTQAFQACMRGLGVRWNAPEWLVSGDASNNSYASSLTAESPFIKTCKRRQKTYASAYERTMWKVLRNRIRAKNGIKAGGRLYTFHEVQQLVRVVATPPTIEVRDRLAEANANQVRVLGGWKSRQMVAAEEGTDWDQVVADTNAWNDMGLGSVLTPDLQPTDPETPADEPLEATGDIDATAGLRATVGGSAAIAALQKSYYGGELPRAAAVANARVVFGFTAEQAETLFPEVAPVKLTPDSSTTTTDVNTEVTP